MTYSRGKRTAPAWSTAAAGYLTPPLLGAAAAALLAARHPAALLWLALVLLAATFLAVRNVFGALAVLVTAAWCSRSATTPRPRYRPASPTWPGSCCWAACAPPST